MDKTLIACHECDLLHSIPELPTGGAARCSRCGALLFANKKNSLDRSLALSFAGFILLILSNAFPIIGIKQQGLFEDITLMEGVVELYKQNMPALSLLVLMTCIVVPFVQLSGMIYVLLPIKMDRIPWMATAIFRFIRKIQPWGMMEVFMLGILVSLVKLASMASIIPGIALYSFAMLIFVLAGAISSLDPHLVWHRLEKRK